MSYIDSESYVATPFAIDPSPAPQAPPQTTMLHPYSGLTGPRTSSSGSTRQMSWSESTGTPMYAPSRDTADASDGSYSGSLAGLAAGVMPQPMLYDPPRTPAKLVPQPLPEHHLATDAGPAQPVDDATPVGEMPPTYDPSWVGSTSSGSSVAGPDAGSHSRRHMPHGSSGQPVGRAIGGSDSKGHF